MFLLERVCYTMYVVCVSMSGYIHTRWNCDGVLDNNIHVLYGFAWVIQRVYLNTQATVSD